MRGGFICASNLTQNTQLLPMLLKTFRNPKFKVFVGLRFQHTLLLYGCVPNVSQVTERY